MARIKKNLKLYFVVKRHNKTMHPKKTPLRKMAFASAHFRIFGVSVKTLSFFISMTSFGTK